MKNPRNSSRFGGFPMVREAGVEPARPCEHWHLKPASLPIPPLARKGLTFSQRKAYDNTGGGGCQQFFSLLTKKDRDAIIGSAGAGSAAKIKSADVLELVDWLA